MGGGVHVDGWFLVMMGGWVLRGIGVVVGVLKMMVVAWGQGDNGAVIGGGGGYGNGWG